ncbi:MAG TPA: ATP-dependent DNA ligase [Phycisphaerae bacterium]|nr:ATP-dependent DNA ligase [Phycisphaerae bacterium]
MLPIGTGFAVMEAEAAGEVPVGAGWQYEPKWDGFRCLAFREGGKVEMRSKAGQGLGRYFPEMVAALLSVKAKKFVVDGELIIAEKKRLDFDALLQRIHPAESRVRKLSVETPATYVVFDFLVDERGRDLTGRPLGERRAALEKFAGKYFVKGGRIVLSPVTREFAEAKRWFQRMMGPLDGVVAKRVDAAYASGEHERGRGGAMVKIKNHRTADCVVGGFRYGTKTKEVGSLLLGLYDEEGKLDHVGFTSGFAGIDKKALTKKLEGLVEGPGFTGKAPGGPSRWSKGGRSAEWKPVKAVLVVEVAYDHFSGGRFRHGTRLLRFRPEKKARSCTMEQVRRESASPVDLLG